MRIAQQPEYLLGSLLFACLLIGGGTMQGLLTDALLQIATILCCALVLTGHAATERVDRGALVLLGFAVVAVSAQLIPLPAGLVEPLRPPVLRVEDGVGPASTWRFISLGFGRTLEVLLFLCSAGAMFLAVASLRPEQVLRVLPFLFLGVICNVLAGAIQYSLAANVEITGFLSYTITAGMFANVNHFSALLYAAIPLITFYMLYRGRFWLGSLGIVAILLILLAAGSRAGVLIGLAITVLALAFLAVRGRASSAAVMAGFLVLSAYTMGAWTKISGSELDPGFGRPEFTRTTIEGIADNWPLGVGYGNFINAYPIYERGEMIFSSYVNHAHNDYLELIFEGGVAAAMLLLFYLVLLLKNLIWLPRNALQRAALLSTAFLLLHSVVDYPLRTMALAMTFAFLNAIVFHAGFARRQQTKPMLEVNHEGRRVLVPIAEPG